MFKQRILYARIRGNSQRARSFPARKRPGGPEQEENQTPSLQPWKTIEATCVCALLRSRKDVVIAEFLQIFTFDREENVSGVVCGVVWTIWRNGFSRLFFLKVIRTGNL